MSAFRAVGIVGVGIASAASVFVLHRVLVSDSPSEGSSAAPPPRQTAAASSVDAKRPSGAVNGLVDAPLESSEIPGDARAENDADPVPSLDPQEASPHIETLRHPSPEHRNVSLATVIRAAGHVCLEVLSSSPGDEDLGTWRVSCDGARAYLVSEDGSGGLRVEPMAFFEVPVRDPLPTIPAPPVSPPR